jgi:type IV pilus assembly protein PilQ
MNMTGKIAIAALFVTAAASSSTAIAETKNEVRAVTFDEDGGITRVHVRGAETPTFTVYKLERPARVVVDLPQAKLSDALRGHDSAAVMTPSTWAVSTIAAQQLDDGAVRVIVTLARPGRYDVKTDGNDVVVMVMPRDPAPAVTDPKELEKAKQDAAAAQAEADAAKAAAAKAQTDARVIGEKARRDAAETDRAKAESDRAKADAAQARDQLARAQTDAERKQAEAKQEIERQRAAAEAAKQEAARIRAEADKAMAAAKRDADAAKSDAAKTAAALAKVRAEAQAARADADRAMHEAAQKRAEADAAKTEVTAAKDDAARTRAEAMRAKSEADAAKAEAAHARSEAEAAKAAAEAARVAAATEKRQAEADKHSAEAARGEAEQMLKTAHEQLATLERKTQSAQQVEDRARAALAAAQAREEAARDAAARAQKERMLAEAAAKQAQDARDRAAASDRDRLIADARAAEERLAQAKRATDALETQRKAAETAAAQARQQLDSTKTALASVEQQRSAAETAATEAARKRSEAEAAASDAARRRSEAEVAAAAAAKQRTEAEHAASEAAQRRGQAEQQRAAAEAMKLQAEQAAREAQVARDAAEKQRKIAEHAASTAEKAKQVAEASLNELETRRLAAERAATELEARTKAEAKAQADVASAQARKASDDEMTRARGELAKLAAQRKQAEDELADRRKAVSQQQSEATRLETAAAQARDAAAREDERKLRLVQQREQEEKELAAIKQQKAQAMQPVAMQPVAMAKTVASTSTSPSPSRSTTTTTPTKTTSKAVAQVKDVKFSGDDDASQIDVVISGDAQVKLGEVTGTHIELLVDGAALAQQKLERTLDVSRFGTPVTKISTFRDRRTADRVRLVAELARPVTPTVDHDATGAHLRFVADVAKHTPRTQNIPPTVVGGFGAASTPVAQQSVSQVPAQGRRRRIYHGATMDLDVQNAPIQELLRGIADIGHVNIIIPDTIDARVTVSLKRVPWDQALEVILASHGLWYRQEGNLYRIAPRKELDAEDEAEAARIKAARENEAPIPEVVTLNYASASDLAHKVEPMLSPKGHVEVDDRTNSLIINDVSGNRKLIHQLALELDTQTPQISIEARIVEARSTFVRQFGVQWGGRALAGATGGNATGLVWPSSIGVIGGNEDLNTKSTGVAAPSDFAVNIPANTSSGEGGALGISLGSVGGNFNINLRLSALEDSGAVRIISAPKITVLNNKEARISQGVSIPIQVVSANGTNTQFVQADLSLQVTPYVSQSDCAIAMNLVVTKNEPDFVNVGARGDPTILRKEARTQMLVNDGETSVLGGIYTRNTGLAYKKIPFFADLPVIGWLFKNRRENDDRTEILVFITPKITNKASLRCK